MNQKDNNQIDSNDNKDKQKLNDNKGENDLLPKVTLKKETNNKMLNQKKERGEEEINNINFEDKSSNNIINMSKKKKSLNEAKKEMKEFELLILNTEKELQKKYGITFPDLSFEDNFPDEIKNKLIDDFLDSPNIKNILNQIDNAQNNKQ